MKKNLVKLFFLLIFLIVLIFGIKTVREISKTKAHSKVIEILGTHLYSTTKSISVELAYKGDENNNAVAALEFRKSTENKFRRGLPLWRVNNSSIYPNTSYYGSILLLEPNTKYIVRISVIDPDGVSENTIFSAIFKGEHESKITRSIKTKNNINLTQLKPKYYVRINGNNKNNGLTEQTAWASLEKAVKDAPANAIVEVGPGLFTSPNLKNPSLKRSMPLTLIAQYPAVNDQGKIINEGRHSVIYYGTFTSPSGSSGPNAGVWQKDNSKDAYLKNLWKWEGPFNGNYLTMLYGKEKDKATSKVAYWQRKVGKFVDDKKRAWEMDTPSGWAKLLRTNSTYNYGFANFKSIIYLRLPDDIDPNTQYIFLSPLSLKKEYESFSFSGNNIRISGFESKQTGIYYVNNSSSGIIDHNLFVSSSLNLIGEKSSITSKDHLVTNNIFIDTNTWSNQQTKDVIPVKFINDSIILEDKTKTPWFAIGRTLNTSAISLIGGTKNIIIKDNIIDGYFNGITKDNTGFNHYESENDEIYNNTISHIANNALKINNQAINIKAWQNKFREVSVVLATESLSSGPMYFFKNEAWQIGANNQSNSSVVFKYSGLNIPTSRIFVINNTFWTKKAGVSVLSNGLTPVEGRSPDAFFLRNNIFVLADNSLSIPSNQYSYGGRSKGYNFFYLAEYQKANTTFASATSEADVQKIFTNPSEKDLTLTQSADIAIDKGITIPNINETFQGNAPDLGAYESTFSAQMDNVATSTPTLTTPTPALELKKGDGNKDGEINLSDLSILLSNFNKKDFPKELDINGDNTVNDEDYTEMLKILINNKVLKSK